MRNGSLLRSFWEISQSLKYWTTLGIYPVLRHLKAHNFTTRVSFLSLFSCNLDDNWVNIFTDLLFNALCLDTLIRKLVFDSYQMCRVPFNWSLTIVLQRSVHLSFVTRRQNRYMLWDFIVILRWIKTLFIIITCILRKSTWEKMQNDNSSCKVETKDASMIPFHREEGFRYQRCLQYGNLGELT